MALFLMITIYLVEGFVHAIEILPNQHIGPAGTPLCFSAGFSLRSTVRAAERRGFWPMYLHPKSQPEGLRRCQRRYRLGGRSARNPGNGQRSALLKPLDSRL